MRRSSILEIQATAELSGDAAAATVKLKQQKVSFIRKSRCDHNNITSELKTLDQDELEVEEASE